jgi:hypothetical protein
LATAIVYGGPSTAVTAPDGTVFPIGVSVPVDDALAASLLLQNFSIAKASEAAPTALSGPAEAPAIQAPAPAVSVASAAVPAAAPAAPAGPVLTPVTGV